MKKLSIKLILLLLPLILLSGSTCGTRSPLEKGKPNPWLGLWMPFTKAGQRAYNHSILRGFRGKSDCQPQCPAVDVWQYQYKSAKGELIQSAEAISSKREHWKIPTEARIVSITLFGDTPKYIQGLESFIKSIQSSRRFNDISDPELWGYETFTFRVYSPKRNPNSSKKNPIEGTLPESFVQTLLELGCEVAFVDNGRDKAGLDATFWRFMISAEKMENGQTIRYLVRDADWLITASDAFTVGEWIDSGRTFHRSHLMPACMGPITAMSWGGLHQGEGLFSDLKISMENYPYRFHYGDDELFLRDIIWPRMLYAGSILSHNYAPGLAHFFSQPYENSCYLPTQTFCDEVNPENATLKTCEDRLIPDNIPFPYVRLGEMKDNASFLSEKDIFELRLQNNERAQKAVDGLRAP